MGQPPRIFQFMQEREDILADVTERVVRDKVTASYRDRSQSLEYVLNEAAYLEMQRLERGSSALDLHPFGYWQELARGLHHLSDVEKTRTIRALTGDYARDVAGRFTPGVYRFATKLLPLGLGTLFNTQNIDTLLHHGKKMAERVILSGAIETWRRLAERGTLVVVPTHSSNLDSIAVGWALHEAGLPPVTYGAGKNLFTSPVTSYFMHNLGAYKVDRRIRHTLYKEVLKAYSEVLLERGYHSLFFPGGTRSRTNHIEKKVKLGLLGTGLSAYAHNLKIGKPNPEVYVCPLTINYHLVLEAETLIDDALRQDGGHRFIIDDDEFSRPKEVAAFLYKMMQLEYTTYIRFGEPLDLFGNPVDANGVSHDTRGRPIDTARYLWRDGQVVQDSARDAEYTRRCGTAITKAFRHNTVVVSTALVAFAAWRMVAQRYPGADLYQRLRVCRGDHLVRAELAAEVDAVLRACKSRADKGELQLAHDVQRLDPLQLIDAALRVFGMFHSAPVLAANSAGAEILHPRLLYYYANRLESLNLSIDKGVA